MTDKLIKLFIMESKKNLKTVDLSNWVGKVFIGNRKHIDIIQTISELSKNTGLYFLLGKDAKQKNHIFILEKPTTLHKELNSMRQAKIKNGLKIL